jgi:hypothetical protein
MTIIEDNSETYRDRLTAFASQGQHFQLEKGIDYSNFTSPSLENLKFSECGIPDTSCHIETALRCIDKIATPHDKKYAELAIRHIGTLLTSEPRIYNAPEGGVVLEHRNNNNILTVIIEKDLGLIILSCDDSNVTHEFKLSQDTVNEFIARYYEALCELENFPEGVTFVTQRTGA